MIRTSPLTSALALTAYGASALAQGPMLEEVIVTAQTRVESLQDVPISIVAVSGEKIDDAGIEQSVGMYIDGVYAGRAALASVPYPSPWSPTGIRVPSLARTTWEDYEQYSQEVRLVSPGGETIDWSATLTARYVMPLSANLVLVNSMDINYEDGFYSALDLDPNTRHNDVPVTSSNSYFGPPDRPRSIAVQARYRF